MSEIQEGFSFQGIDFTGLNYSRKTDHSIDYDAFQIKFKFLSSISNHLSTFHCFLHLYQ